MHIAQVVETLAAGGAEGLAVDFANSLAARGHQSHLIVMDGRGPFRDRISDQVNFLDLELPGRRGSVFSNAVNFRRTYQALSSVLKEDQVGVVQTHLPRANFLGLFLGKGGVAKVFPTVHNNREFDYGDYSNRVKDHLRKKAYRMMLSWCQAMICISDQVRVAMMGELKVAGSLSERLVVIRNGVPVSPPLAIHEKDVIRQQWSVGEQDVLLVAVGRLTPQKNFCSLIEALAQIPETRGSWKCLIAGEGDQRNSLAREISARGLEGKVILAGHVPEIGRLLGAADVFCLSSRYEGLPLVLLEAMAAGLPVCAYGIDGVADVVQNGVQANLARPEDPGDLARAINELLADPGLRQELGSAGRALVQSKFNFERAVDQLEELFTA